MIFLILQTATPGGRPIIPILVLIAVVIAVIVAFLKRPKRPDDGSKF